MVEQKKLFKVKTVPKYHQIEMIILATQDTIDSMMKYNKSYYLSIEVLGEHDYTLPSFDMTTQSGVGGRSYSVQYYTITCDQELTQDDLNVLRALGAFMQGQRHGELTKVKRDGDKFIHELVSECDSGD